MYRRAFLGVSVSSLLTGCMWFRSAGDGYILIRNQKETTHTVDVTLIQQRSGETVLDESYRIDPDSQREIEDAFNGGVYEATVSLDDGRTETFELNVGRCPSIAFRVTIAPEELDLQQGTCD
ncbi:hypothetical protein [Haloparvum sedimenti]|uniref:hypothetical protein n=1 Tax=Haloparvum sedimenti TaxID=1678448 RepID=UPI000F76CC5B|nr:hypothetical protein [Haloparvum sedimenti]